MFGMTVNKKLIRIRKLFKSSDQEGPSLKMHVLDIKTD
jgi:hypothetical protein